MTLADRWRSEVYRDRRINNATRVVLLQLCEHMDPDGCVSVPRSRLASLLAVNPSRITEALRLAHQAGLLATVTPGRPGTTAKYAARISDGAPVRTKRRESRGAPVRTKDMVGIQNQALMRPSAPSGGESHAQHGAPVWSPSSTQPQRSDAAETTGSNVASATENPSTPSSDFSSHSPRSGEPPLAAGLSSPSAPPTQVDDAAASDSKVTAGVAVAAVARPPEPVTAAVEGNPRTGTDTYQAARDTLGQLNAVQRDKCMAHAFRALGEDVGNADLIMFAADVARAEIGVS